MNILYEKFHFSDCSPSDDPQKAYYDALRTAKAERFQQLALECSCYAQTAVMDIRLEQDDLLQRHIHLWAQRLHFNVRFFCDGKDRLLFSSLFTEADQVVLSCEPETGLLHLHFVFSF